MPRPELQKRVVTIAAKVTEKTSKSAVKKCERLEITLSEYLNRLIDADLNGVKK